METIFTLVLLFIIILFWNKMQTSKKLVNDEKENYEPSGVLGIFFSWYFS